MSNLWYTLNSVKLFPKLPIARSTTPVEEVLTMAPGNERTQYLRTRREWVLTRPRASEALRTTWLSAAVWGQSLTLIDPDGGTYTVKVTAWDDPISKSTPDANDSATATGPLEFDLSLSLREV